MARSNAYPISSSADLAIYQFVSIGSTKTIVKRIEFESLGIEFESKQLYNLAFGDVDEQGNVKDDVDSNNGDLVKIMSTIIATIYEFTSHYPERSIYFTGSDKQRTNFYREVLTRRYMELVADFDIYGVVNSNSGSDFELFQSSQMYDAFIVTRKLNATG